MLWQELACYNRFAETEIVNAPLSITLTLNTQIALGKTYLPNNSVSATNSWVNPTSMNLSVPDQMLIVELTPAPEPGGLLGAGMIVCGLSRRARRIRRRL